MTNQFNLIFRSEKGLTLIEIMISIVLLAFVMLGVVAIIDNSQNAKDRTLLINNDNMQIEMAINRMEWDFAQIWSPLYFSQRFMGNLDGAQIPGIEEIKFLYEGHPRFSGPSQDGIPIPVFRLNGKDDLIFMTNSNRRRIENQKQSHFSWVRYFISDQRIMDGAGEGRDTKALTRQIFSDDPWAKEDFALDSTRSTSLLNDVTKLEFQFYNPGTRKWETNLRSIRDGESVIRGIKMLIVWNDSNGNEREMTRFFRPHYPPVTIMDPVPGAVGGAAGGAMQAGVQGGAQGGQGEANPDDPASGSGGSN
jgi:hypothetical protein